MVRHIKGRIEALHAFRRHRLLVPHLFDLIRIPLLDLYIRPGRAVHIDRRTRPQRIERYPVMLCQNGDAGSPDLVRKITVRSNAVAANETGLHPAVLHDHGSHVVADQRDVDPGFVQLIGCQARALQQRSGLVGESLKINPAFFPEQQRADCRTVFAGRQRAGVAVREHTVTGFDQRQPVFGNAEAHFYIFSMDRNGFFFKNIDQFSRSTGSVFFRFCQHSFHRPA